ncbi:MAG: aryl-sulfate sulfotransferase [Myxococcota bacterium]|nr:aryl-sulfate sulfotransferase [Myxococcota bacterium]
MLLLLLGCATDIQDPSQTVGDIGTVVTVQWWSPLAVTGQVQLTAAAGTYTLPATRVASEGGYAYAAPLLGLTSDETAEAEIQLLDGDAVVATTPLSVHAGRLDMVLPNISLDESLSPPAGLLLTSFAEDPAAAVILNEAGKPVWAVLGTEGTNISETRLHPDGGQIIFGEYLAALDDAPDRIVRVGLSGSPYTIQPAPGLHHDLDVLPDGTVAYIAYDTREVDGELIQGDRIMELSEDGTLVEVWSAWDALSYTADTPSSGSGWTHANALNYAADEDAYYLSLHNYNAILMIDRATGETRWTLGGPGNDFDLPKSAIFRRQHQFQVLNDSILIFDNGSMSEGYTEIHELTLDTAAMTATPLWNYQPTESLYTLVLGDVQRLNDGDTLITYCGSGIVEQVSPQAEVRWRLYTPLSVVLGYSTHLSEPADFFRPTDQR